MTERKSAVCIDSKVEAANDHHPLAAVAFGVVATAGSFVDGRPLVPGMDDVSLAVMTATLQRYFEGDMVLGIDICGDGSGDFVLLTHKNDLLRCSLKMQAGTIEFKAKAIEPDDLRGNTLNLSVAEDLCPQLVLARMAFDMSADPRSLNLTGGFNISVSEAVRRKLYFEGTGVVTSDDGGEPVAVEYQAGGVNFAHSLDESALMFVNVDVVEGDKAKSILEKYAENKQVSGATA